MPDFLVTGATGTVGRLLVRLLAARGAQVRAMARHPETDGSLRGVEPWFGDLDDPGSVRTAMVGVRSAFVLTGGPDGPRHDQTIAEAAADAGVEHLVKLSVLGITEGADDVITAWHRAGEEAITRVGVPANFVRPGAFMSNALNWAPSIAATGTVHGPVGDLPVACIDPIDIAAVAYHLLATPGPPGEAYALTGPEAISPRRQADVLGEQLGRPVHFVEISAEQARAEMVRHGMPAVLADAVIASVTSPQHGHNQQPTATVERVTGLRPRRFADWASDHLDVFADPSAT